MESSSTRRDEKSGQGEREIAGRGRVWVLESGGQSRRRDQVLLDHRGRE